MLYSLIPKDQIVFPHPCLAGPEGLVAIGGDLSLNRLLLAYQFGIFPWYSMGQPILWWSPNPRMVIFPDKVIIARSMRSYFNQEIFKISLDSNFEDVIRSCSTVKRKNQTGTWITEDMIQAYINLHKEGIAHSVEVWQKKELVGGLYGLGMGKIFYGESMFTHISNASKFGLINLAKLLNDRGYLIIDCQQETEHMRSLGARTITRQNFLIYLRANIFNKLERTKWSNWNI